MHNDIYQTVLDTFCNSVHNGKLIINAISIHDNLLIPFNVHSFLTGMFGVAISRVRDLNSLRIVNFHPNSVSAPGAAIQAFADEEGSPVEEQQNTCCKRFQMQNEEVPIVRTIFFLHIKIT